MSEASPREGTGAHQGRSPIRLSALADAHTHLDQHHPEELPGILERARAAGVRRIIVAGVTVPSSERCVALAREHPDLLWAGVGVHPMEQVEPMTNATLDRLRHLARSPGVVCISEVGLDHLPGMPDRTWQEESFRAQIGLAVERGLPIVFHNREAGLEPLRILREEGGTRVGLVAHYFQGPRDYAFACLDLGVYLSLAKPLLRLVELQDLVRDALPLDRIVLETDSYPQPWKRRRSNWTEPAHLPQIAAKVAELKGLPLEEAAAVTTANLARALGRASVATQVGSERV